MCWIGERTNKKDCKWLIAEKDIPIGKQMAHVYAEDNPVDDTYCMHKPWKAIPNMAESPIQFFKYEFGKIYHIPWYVRWYWRIRNGGWRKRTTFDDRKVYRKYVYGGAYHCYPAIRRAEGFYKPNVFGFIPKGGRYMYDETEDEFVTDTILLTNWKKED